VRLPANPLALQQRTCSANVLRQPFARLFFQKRDGRSYHCCSPHRTGLCGNSPRDNRRDKRRCHQQQRCRWWCRRPGNGPHL